MSRIYKTTEPFFLQGHGNAASTHIMMIHGFRSRFVGYADVSVEPQYGLGRSAAVYD